MSKADGFFRSLDWLRAHAENCRVLTLSLHHEGEGPFWLCLTTYHGQVLVMDLNVLPKLPEEMIPSELRTVLKDFLLLGEDMGQVLGELGLERQPYLDRDAVDLLNYEHPNFPYCLNEDEVADRGFLTALMFDFYPGPLGDMEEEDRPLGLNNSVEWSMLYPLGERLTTLKLAYLRMVGLAGFYSVGLFSLLVFSEGQMLTPREAVISMLLNQAASRLIRMVYSERTVRRLADSPREFSIASDNGLVCTVQKPSPNCSFRSDDMSGEDDVLDLGPGSPFGSSELGPREDPVEETKSDASTVVEANEDAAVFPGVENETGPKEVDSSSEQEEEDSECGSEDSWVDGFEVPPVEEKGPEEQVADLTLDGGGETEVNQNVGGIHETSATVAAPAETGNVPEVVVVDGQEFSAEGAVGGEAVMASTSSGTGTAGSGGDESDDRVFAEEEAVRSPRGVQRGERAYSWSQMRASGTVPQHLWEAGQIGNQYRGILTSDPYQPRRTKLEGEYGPQRKPRVSVPQEGVEVPVRYFMATGWGRACNFCGATNHVSTACEAKKRLISRHGASATRWPVTCLYPYCFNKRGHKTAACPALHAFCSSCRRRGHLNGSCGRLPAVGEQVIAENYVLYCSYGRYTRNYLNRFELDWSFLGPKVDRDDLVEVGVGNHRAMVGWDAATLAEFQEADEARKHSMITREVFR